MKTLSHWQWLVLLKSSPVFRKSYGATRIITGENNHRHPLTLPCPLPLRGWLSFNLTNFLTKPKSIFYTQPGVGEGAVYFCYGKRASRASRFNRSVDHSFLVAGVLRFGEELSGAPFSLLILKNLLQTAHPLWVLEVFFLHSRLSQVFNLSRSKNKMLITSPSHPWYGGAKIIVSSVCSRDPFLLAQWAKKRMGKMKLFAHKRFLRLLGSFLRGYVNLKTDPTKILGFNLVTTGKISVTGNAMSRTMLTRFGKAGINNLSYRASSSFVLIKTKTGCLGLNLVFYY